MGRDMGRDWVRGRVERGEADGARVKTMNGMEGGCGMREWGGGLVAMFICMYIYILRITYYNKMLMIDIILDIILY